MIGETKLKLHSITDYIDQNSNFHWITLLGVVRDEIKGKDLMLIASWGDL